MAKVVSKFSRQQVTEAMLKDAANSSAQTTASGVTKDMEDQLVVHSDYREQRPATVLLSTLIDSDDDVFGIASSHPAACKTLAKAIGDFRFSDVSMDFAWEHAANVLKASPITYMREAKLRGSLFHSNDTSGMVSGVDSNYYVDHAEPFEALAWFKEGGNWPLGELPEGHEFLFLVEKARRRRSHFASHPSG
ncbi:putative conserved hypothetical protein [Colletotrichum sublineola]|uniref:Uncharacterized protein n=1 Tax=Colletotrichum sublineola TaxID=1173701 RepID=A0A066XY04_COLSU|nr:putative conserved hypothetical protein [Colletotrichum sublineola]